MADVASSRPPASRGRPAGRAGRAGHSSRGATRSAARQAKDDPNAVAAAAAAAAPSLEEQGELGQLKLQYKSQLDTLSELFPDWTDDDLVIALNEADGDLQTTIERISEGNVSQFSDVKKKTKEKSRSKKETTTESTPAPSRGRGRGGHESGRGGRGRGSERGGRARGARGPSGSAANGDRSASATVSVPTAEVAAWGDSPNMATTATTSGDSQPAVETSSSGQWGSIVASEVTPATASEGQKSSLIPEGSKKSWASMLAQKPAPAVPKPVAAAVPPKPLAPDIGSEPRDRSILESSAPAMEPLAVPLSDVDVAPSYPSSIDVPANLAPPKDQLTEDNLEALPDESIPVDTDTVASTRDASSVGGSLTPYGSSSQVPTVSRPPMGGYATTAWKATATPGRSASYQRRMMEQREAVVMPGNHAVDRAAIQFGNMGLNSGENRPLDVDEDREETQTRTLPQQSPPQQPRASLPPAPRQPPVPEPLQEGIPTPKPAPGLPFTSQPPSSMPNPASSQHPLTSQSSQSFGGYGRLPGGPLHQDPAAAPNQKVGYDPFSQQLSYSQAQQDNAGLYQTQSQLSNPSQPLSNFGQGSAEPAHQFSSEQQRSAYQNYYGAPYNQQAGTGQQDQNVPPQRSTSGFAGDSGYGSGQATAAAGSRISENQNSGHTTPNPAMVTQHQMAPHSQQAQHMHQQPPGQAGHSGNFAYQNPYYGNSYYNSYMSGYPNNYYGQQGYGAPFGGKSNMYGQPHHGYGMTPQASYEHSSSPANAGTFGSSGVVQGRDNVLSGGLADYARSGSAQASQPGTTGGGAFSNTLADGFSRGAGGFGQNQQYGQQQQQSDEPLKGFNEPKTGPSPALGQPGRAGSTVNNAAYGGNQSNYAPPQQSGFGGYPSHLNQLHGSHNSQYGGLGGLGGHQGNAQSHQAGGYGGYGSGFGNSYGNYGRGGWGGNYGGH